MDAFEYFTNHDILGDVLEVASNVDVQILFMGALSDKSSKTILHVKSRGCYKHRLMHLKCFLTTEKDSH